MPLRGGGYEMKHLLAVFLMLCWIFAGRPVGVEANGNSREVMRRCLAMWETGDVARFDDVIASDYVGHVASGTRDRAGLAARIAAFHGLYPDIRFYVDDQFTNGDKIVTRMRAVGTNSKTGTKVELMGINISRIAKEKLVEEWATWEPTTSK